MGSTALTFEDKVEKILDGDGLEVKEIDCAPEQIKPVVLRKTVCYIVCAVIFNAKNEVLMMQETKPECYGRWYLPAGRMEEKESIVEAMSREVKEETGMDSQPITLLLVQDQGPQWIRFVFLAEVTGGDMKTEEQADAESLQARWWDRESPLPLRARDILCLIEAGLRYREKPGFPLVLPVEMPCPIVCLRPLLTFCSPESHLWFLLVGSQEPHLPVVAVTNAVTVTWAGYRLLKQCIPSSYRQFSLKPCGLLGVQHGGRTPGQADGVCFNMLLSVEHTSEIPEASQLPLLEDPSFQWHKVENAQLKDRIVARLTSGSLLPLHNLLH
ncbi:hypothetical protein GJAV_G00032110 [Gymnothorax javanicus]|nr:hypothetical protein GJAV_G00032110 [Gymnothorax javanicus]